MLRPLLSRTQKSSYQNWVKGSQKSFITTSSALLSFISMRAIFWGMPLVIFCLILSGMCWVLRLRRIRRPRRGLLPHCCREFMIRTRIVEPMWLIFWWPWLRRSWSPGSIWRCFWKPGLIESRIRLLMSGKKHFNLLIPSLTVFAKSRSGLWSILKNSWSYLNSPWKPLHSRKTTLRWKSTISRMRIGLRSWLERWNC